MAAREDHKKPKFQAGVRTFFSPRHTFFSGFGVRIRNMVIGHYAVNLKFSFQEPVRRKSYAEILNGDDKEDEKVDNSD